MQLAALVLAGGRSRRMGRPKESLPIAGTTMLGLAVERMLLYTAPVLVSARDEQQELPPLPVEAELTYDSEPDAGPLAALRDGMRALAGRCDAVLLLGCDMPYFDGRAVDFLARALGDAPLVMPRADGRLQPLSSVYRLDLLPRIEQLVARAGQNLRALAELPGARVLEEAELRAFDPELRFLRNVNDEAAWRRAVADLGP